MIDRYVDTDDGNDTTGDGLAWGTAWKSLSKAESANLDLVAAEDDCTIHCRGTTADPTAIRIIGWTTSATYRLYIVNEDGHNGKWTDTAYRLEGNYNAASGALVEITAPGFVTFVDMQFNMVAAETVGTRYVVYCNAPGVHFQRCIARVTGDLSGSRHGFYLTSAVAATPTLVWNCLAYDILNNAFNGNGEADSVFFYNCTAVDSGIGFGTSTEDSQAYMCLASDCTDGFFGTWSTTNHNASTTDDGGTNGHNVDRGTEFAFVDYAGDDFHLTASFDGTTDPSSGLYTDDIDSVARAATYDIGADEYVAAGGASIVPLLMNFYRRLRV